MGTVTIDFGYYWKLSENQTNQIDNRSRTSTNHYEAVQLREPN